MKGEKGLAEYEWQGSEKIVTFAPVPGMNWFLATSVPKNEVTGMVSSLTTISLITILVVLVLAGLLSAWFARRIARPIQALEAAANQIAAGDLALTKLDIDTNDEIGRLGRSFEQMAGSLRDLIRKTIGATEQVAASSEELTASSEQAAQAANHIATAITTVAARRRRADGGR